MRSFRRYGLYNLSYFTKLGQHSHLHFTLCHNYFNRFHSFLVFPQVQINTPPSKERKRNSRFFLPPPPLLTLLSLLIADSRSFLAMARQSSAMHRFRDSISSALYNALHHSYMFLVLRVSRGTRESRHVNGISLIAEWRRCAQRR